MTAAPVSLPHAEPSGYRRKEDLGRSGSYWISTSRTAYYSEPIYSAAQIATLERELLRANTLIEQNAKAYANEAAARDAAESNLAAVKAENAALQTRVCREQDNATGQKKHAERLKGKAGVAEYTATAMKAERDAALSSSALLREALTKAATALEVPPHKMDDMAFLRASISIANGFLDAALAGGSDGAE